MSITARSAEAKETMSLTFDQVERFIVELPTKKPAVKGVDIERFRYLAMKDFYKKHKHSHLLVDFIDQVLQKHSQDKEIIKTSCDLLKVIYECELPEADITRKMAVDPVYFKLVARAIDLRARDWGVVRGWFGSWAVGYADPEDTKMRARSPNDNLLSTYQIAYRYARDNEVNIALSLYARFLLGAVIGFQGNGFSNLALTEDEINFRFTHALTYINKVANKGEPQSQSYAKTLVDCIMLAEKEADMLEQIRKDKSASITLDTIMMHLLNVVMVKDGKIESACYQYLNGIRDSIGFPKYDNKTFNHHKQMAHCLSQSYRKLTTPSDAKAPLTTAATVHVDLQAAKATADAKSVCAPTPGPVAIVSTTTTPTAGVRAAIPLAGNVHYSISASPVVSATPLPDVELTELSSGPKIRHR